MGLLNANEQFIRSRMEMLHAGENLIKELRKVLEGLPLTVGWGVCDCNSIVLDVIGIYSRENVSLEDAYYGFGEAVRGILSPWVMVYGVFSKETAEEIIRRLKEALSQKEE